MKRYDDCFKDESTCALCSLCNYKRDCHNNPVNNLAYFRALKGLSQLELAELTGIKLDTLAKYEQGILDINCAKASVVRDLADVLGVADLRDLLELEI